MQPGVPAFLPPLQVRGELADRLDLARWLVDGQHPFTARVFVNRLWALYFGKGLSKVLDDLGSQGEWPSHPELLDWLAVEFQDSGWDVKHLVRQIVTSRTYRQSSRSTPEQRAWDPDNRRLTRQTRYRLPAELIRDQALAVSGLLVRRIGGESCRPYQPAGYYAHLNFPEREYEPDDDESQYRRGVYMHWQRQFLHPALKAFDAPSREECTAERTISNTPLAALTLLNDPTFVECARVLAQVVVERGDTPESSLRWVFRHVLCRDPSESEFQTLWDLYQRQTAWYQAHPQEAQALVAIGLTPPPAADTPQVAAWTSVTRALLNLSETITRN